MAPITRINATTSQIFGRSTCPNVGARVPGNVMRTALLRASIPPVWTCRFLEAKASPKRSAIHALVLLQAIRNLKSEEEDVVEQRCAMTDEQHSSPIKSFEIQ